MRHPRQLSTATELVSALCGPAAYPGETGPVEAIETHMSWVFLTRDHAWKLKKPVRYGRLDFRRASARRFYCLEELRLNRRLAPAVYLDVVPVTREADGALRVAGTGPAVDWLVQMRRLAADRMLDVLLARHEATPAQLAAVAAALCAMYRALPAAPLGHRAYGALLLRHIDEHEEELADPAWRLPAARVHALAAGQRAFVAEHKGLLADRIAAARVVEAHGDLRPEHVWLGEPLAIIDALEFSAELRLQDAADEVGFLALECERAHAAALGQALLDAYRAGSGDDVPAQLVHFYQSCRACSRAGLAIAHLREPRYRDAPKWRHRALRYLVLAQRHLRAAEITPPAAR
jgi:aminoglycoside phosphotransferase family enzyme